MDPLINLNHTQPLLGASGPEKGLTWSIPQSL